MSALFVAEPAAHYLTRPPLVVDASAVCAILFDEPSRGDAASRLAGHLLCAPDLLSHEFVSMALKKRKLGWLDVSIAQALKDFEDLAIDLYDTDVAAQYELAVRYGLSAYDAAYLWLAADLKAPLATFDAKLAKIASAHLGGLK